jgi:hypothetical protein
MCFLSLATCMYRGKSKGYARCCSDLTEACQNPVVEGFREEIRRKERFRRRRTG